MSANQQVLTLIREMNQYYKKETGGVYPDAEGKSILWDRIQRRIQRVMENPKKYYMIDGYLKALSEWYLDHSQYARACLHDPARQRTAFAQSAWCGYQAVKVKGEFNRFLITKTLRMQTVMLFWSECILAGWFDEATEIGQRSLAPAEQGGRAMTYGRSFDTASYFLLELHYLWQNIPFDRKTEGFDHPLYDEHTPFIYEDILDHWNTRDTARVDDYVTRMADYHLTQTEEETETSPEDDYFEFNDTFTRLFPYEIMAWLKLREHLGLPNPAKYSHPLMQQPLAEFIPDTPLDKPDMPQVETLLQIVRDALPGVRL